MQSSSRKSKHVDIPEWQTGDDPIAPDGICVRELNVDQRMKVLAAMRVSADGSGGAEATLPLNLLSPYTTDLITDPHNGVALFEPADRDYLLENHPGAVSRVLMTAFTMSDLGQSALERETGN